MDFFGKTFWQAFVGSFLAIILSLAIGVLLITNYVDSKLETINTVVSGLKTIVETSVGQVEKLTDTLVEGTDKIDDKITETKVWKRVFGKGEDSPAE